MKIVCADNFNRGLYPEEFVTKTSLDLETAREITNYLNSRYCSSVSQYYYKVVEDEYKLEPGFQP